MSNFDIEEEIEKVIDKMADQLKNRIKKMVIRSEKQVLRQYVAAQKEAAKRNGPMPRIQARGARVNAVQARTNNRDGAQARGPRGGARGRRGKQSNTSRRAPRREQDYRSDSESEFSQSE